MNLLSINSEDPSSHFLLYRGFNVIREFQYSSVEEVLALSYFESIFTSTNSSNLLFLKTILINNQDKFPKLINFIYRDFKGPLGKNFFSSKEFSELKVEIILFAKRFVGRNLKDIKQFSRDFNVAVTFFDNMQIYDIFEGVFMDPVQVAIARVGCKAYIVYMSDETQSNAKVPVCDIQMFLGLFNEFGMVLREIVEGKTPQGKELSEYQGSLQKLAENSEVNWGFTTNN